MKENEEKFHRLKSEFLAQMFLEIEGLAHVPRLKRNNTLLRSLTNEKLVKNIITKMIILQTGFIIISQLSELKTCIVI